MKPLLRYKLSVTWDESLLKLAEGFLRQDNLGDILDNTHKSQLGCGVSGGIEMAVHTARTLLYMHRLMAWLRIDSSNAFNSLFTLSLLRAVAKKVPILLPFLLSKYGLPSTMVFDGVPVTSQRGVNQGGPLSSHVFTLAFDAIPELIEQLFPEIICLAIMDDIYLFGEV